MTQSTTRHPIRIGVQLRQQHTTYQSYADAVRRAEDLGVDTIWDWDHFFPLTGDPQGSNFEGWTLLTAMATMTQRAEIGCLVTCNSYRNPIPILLGGGGEKVTLRLVAQYATISNTFGDPPTVAHKMQALDNWCTKVGRNPNEIERSISLPRSVSLSQLEAYVQVGATHIIVEVDTPWTFDFLRTLLRWRRERSS